jgi:glycosyltransferase involved in cell wall biosynthesis
VKLVFVMAYPIYHDGLTADQWMALHNQNRWIPGTLAEMGHQVEYWAGDHVASEHTSQMDGFPDYPVRFFKTDPIERRTKFHQSRAMVAEALRRPADAYFVKGVDGGLGVHLVRGALRKRSIPYVALTGGAFYHSIVRGASAVLFESQYQRRKLVEGSWTRPRISDDRLVHMYKSVDLDAFRPDDVQPEYDVVTACRLDERNKSFAELGELSHRYRVAVAGKGLDAETLRARYPRITWVGHVPNADLPQFYASGRLFLHNGKWDRKPTRDFFPRVLAEAMAAGRPCLAFDDIIQPDVLPPYCGRLVSRENILPAVAHLLSDSDERQRLGQNARAHAVKHLGKRSAKPALEHALRLL